MAIAIPVHGDRRRMRIGLLGGSFNPAHSGHRHIAEAGLRYLRLDQVWLLVSPGNPLKPAAGMASLADRLRSARKIADGRLVVATDIEARLGTRYTRDTIRQLKRRFPRVRFVWLMGADNLTQLPRWRDWISIARDVAFAVLPRPTYNHSALAGQAARRFRHARLPASQAPVLAARPPPAWVFLTVREDRSSATEIRRAAAGEPKSPASPPRHRPPAPPPAPRSRNDAAPSRW